MASISAKINLIDSLSGPMQRMIASTENLISHMNDVEGAMNDGFNPQVIEEAGRQAEVFTSQMNTVSSSINNAEAEQQNFDDSIQQSANSMDALVGKVKGMLAAYLSISAIIGSSKGFMEAANVQIEAETKLSTVMRQRMGANDDLIQSVKNLASEQQNLGVIGDEVQMAGAQQLSTFLYTADALKTLMPAMDNLAAQQNGVSASSGDLVNIGNLMGKVMQGQVSALTRVGVTFSEAQEKVLKYGNEQEKAAMLAQVITDNVGNMNAELAKTPAGQMAQVSNALGDMKEVAGYALMPAILALNDVIKNNAAFIESAIINVGVALGYIIEMATAVVDAMFNACSFIADNWSVIEPIVMGIVAAFAIYNGILLVHKGILLASAVVHGIVATATAIHTAFTSGWSIATFTATAAQQGLNAALLACPITWIILAIIAIIAAVYAVIAAINKVTGSTISATGVIMGVISSFVAFIWNTFLAMFEFILGIINALINPFIEIANFIGNVFTNPISSIIYLFQGMADGVLATLEKIASAMDFIFGSNMADTVQGWRGGLKAMADAAVAEYAPNEDYQKVMDNLDLSAESLGMKRWEYSDAFNKGYSAGENLENGVKDFMGNMFNAEVPSGFTPGGNGIEGNVADIAKNTGKAADSLEISGEDLKYLRDIAERDTINRFTTAEIKIDMKNNNNISSGADLDGLVSDLAEKAGAALSMAAEGVHK
jgi:hypothetical protein|nr:MAG TPA: tail tape measure [Caudoviricetes sp.]